MWTHSFMKIKEYLNIEYLYGEIILSKISIYNINIFDLHVKASWPELICEHILQITTTEEPYQ